MSLVSASLKRPIAILVVVSAIFLSSFLAIKTIPIDIFPKLNLPTIYVIEPYGGMTPQQMEGFFSTRLQDQFLYVSGIKNVTSKNVQGLSILKLSFFDNTDMAEASAQVALQLNRAMQFFPPGALPPQVIRFDASSLPVGSLVFSSDTKKLEEINDLAATRIRPLFATIPGLSAPPPIGSNQRTIVVNIDPDRLRSFNLTPDEVVASIARNNMMAPSGNIRMGNTMYMATTNSLENTVEAFGDIPVKTDADHTIFLHDVGQIKDGADVTTGYALINGKRSVYMPIVKTADASTWDVVQKLKKTLPEMQTLLPDDVHVSYEFDQSVFVMNSVKSLVSEGVIGAVLTALMVLVFLKDWRSCIIVVITIPVSVLSAVLCLKLAGQTINIMTLSGLALAIGILVDQATVTIENIHQHLEMGKNKKQAIYDACTEIAFPLFLILLCIIAVFAPSFVMQGVPRALFLPLSLSIGFAMIISYLLAQSLVPVISNWLLKDGHYHYEHGKDHAHAGLALNDSEVGEVNLHTENEIKAPEKNDGFERFKMRFMRILEKTMPNMKRNVILYLAVVLALTGVCFVWIGKDLLPKTNTGQYQVKLRLPDGTRLERTEDMVQEVLQVLDSITNDHVAISSAYAGMVPSNYATANLYIFNAGTQEATLQVQLDEDFKMGKDKFQEALRAAVAQKIPGCTLSFEPIELTEKIMSQGAATPIEVEVAGKDMKQIEDYTDKLVDELKQISFLRDVHIQQPLKYPVVKISLDRFKVAQLGLNMKDVSRSVAAFTSSSRYTEKNLWLDSKSAYTFQVQAQVPEYIMNSLEDLKEIPLQPGQSSLVLQDVASFQVDTAVGEYDRTGPRRFVTIGANLYKTDLKAGTDAVGKAIKEMGATPKGLVVAVKGMSSLLTETLDSLQQGLMFAIIVIFLLLAANYQSFKVALSVLATVPAVLLGALLILLATGATLNLQSYMGIIMSTGVSVANAILIVTNAEKLRLDYNGDALKAATVSASVRLRPILMTSLAMIAGMIPMASGMGEAGDQTAPLGRAVIGGLIASTIAALLIVPQVYAWVRRGASIESPSLLPETIN
ncbi:efflux RND transporter permease subunit [Taibaiella soli]|uniref:AcrB/AcrD/AcrF family protein n=1 Tax=Taibaiella soli TaxID=1649169 RepID=A0A2W2ASZ9_9BACT|nr:efflux RND transporter permease subunit [Taibaiella soli]PZF70818.1 AcrB/AcrD/AcrF family protein [Taibaiella soli]